MQSSALVARVQSRDTLNDPHVREDAWALTRAISPRAAVRAYTEHGVVSRRGLRTRPDGPWAMYLAEALPGRDAGHAYRFLGFDFDAHGDEAAGSSAGLTRRDLVLEDLAVLVELLDRVGIDHVVCRSSSNGGYHVWVAMAEPLSPSLASSLGHALHASDRDSWAPLLTTLDRGMLSNPRMGCLRPPLSPHRDGSRSELVAGTLTTLLQPTTTVAHVTALIDEIRPLLTLKARPHVPGSAVLTDAGAVPPSSRSQTRGRLAADARGHPYIPGAKRSLPAAAAKALATPVGITDDASAILATILNGAARAHWRLADVAELVDSAPGLERIRTMRHLDRRVPRPPSGDGSPDDVLRRDWSACVRYVASTPTQQRAVDDEEFRARERRVVEAVEHVRARIRATPGRWARPGGASDQRVLLQLCVYALAAVRTEIEADLRRLADDVGIGKSTVGDALRRLERDGMARRVAEAEGPRAARWSITPLGYDLHRETTSTWTQAASSPRARLALLETLRNHTAAAAHDVFTPRALGHHAGNVYAQLLEDGDLPADPRDRGLRRLLEHGIALRLGPRIQPGPDTRDLLAKAYGTTGILQQRRRRHALDRQLWAWWLAELEWMHAPYNEKRSRTWKHPRMPRRSDRVHFGQAAEMVREGGLPTSLESVDELLAA